MAQHSSGDELSPAWELVCRLFDKKLRLNGPNPNWDSFHQALCKFGPHSAKPDDLRRKLVALYRGVPLVQSAVLWQEPIVGNRSSRPTKTDRVRGFQWRLVIAYAGFEIAVKKLVDTAGSVNVRLNNFANLVSKTAQLSCPPNLIPPSLTAHQRNSWLGHNSTAEGTCPTQFLETRGADEAAIERLLIHHQAIKDWSQLIQLSKALRNATVHGTLSATRARQWKLSEILQHLAKNLAILLAHGLNLISYHISALPSSEASK
jgi:hypothetical protein